MKTQISVGDTVKVIAGDDKGLSGIVLSKFMKKSKGPFVTVQGASMKTHFSAKDGITKQEGRVHISNVSLQSKKTVAKAKKSKK